MGCRVPKRKHFETVLERARKPDAGNFVGGRYKVRKVKWCLAESVRKVNRRRLGAGQTISLYQDGRKARLVMRFGCATASLERWRGTVGGINLADEFHDTKAPSIANGTMKIIRNFCTKNRAPPFIRGRRRGRKFLRKLFKHIVSNTELIVTDAAADEKKACQLLREVKEGLPNIKEHILDALHCVRRLRVNVHRCSYRVNSVPVILKPIPFDSVFVRNARVVTSLRRLET